MDMLTEIVFYFSGVLIFIKTIVRINEKIKIKKGNKKGKYAVIR